MNSDNQQDEKSTGIPENVGTFLKRVLSVVKDAINEKQDVITGTPGQVVGFDLDGNMEAQDFQGGGPVTSGVSSFNGRSGAVMPKPGDYTPEMIGADAFGAAQDAADTVRTEVEGKITEVDQKFTGSLQEASSRIDAVEQGLDDKISSSGGTMQAALVFAQQSVSRSATDSGSVSMQDDALTISSSTGIVKLVDEADGKNAVLSGVDFAAKSNEAVPFQQMQEYIETQNTSLKQELQTEIDNIELTPGPPGTAGVDGDDGATFTPSVSNDGVISWTNDKGLQNPEPVNIKGSDGVQGPPGEGVPAGGSSGQVLAKASATDYDTQWVDPPEGGGGTINGVTHEELQTELSKKQDVLSNGVGTTVENNSVNVSTPVQGIITQAEFELLSEEERNIGMYFVSGEKSYKIVISGEISEINVNGITMEQVNEAISNAISGAIEEVYYGTESVETFV